VGSTLTTRTVPFTALSADQKNLFSVLDFLLPEYVSYNLEAIHASTPTQRAKIRTANMLPQPIPSQTQKQPRSKAGAWDEETLGEPIPTKKENKHRKP
jgi:hypothetical protein